MVFHRVDPSKRRDRAPLILAPHSWDFDSWPEPVWPHNGKRAKWIARAFRDELIAAGAISRVGRIIVFLGAPYTRWMMSQASRVAGFEANNPGIGTGVTPAPGAGRPRKVKPTTTKPTTKPTAKSTAKTSAKRAPDAERNIDTASP